MFLFQLKIMPPKRGRKKRVIPKKEEAKLNVNEESVVIDDESGDERLRLAIEESKKIQSKEDDDLKKALERSVEEEDEKEDLKRALEQSVIDVRRSNSTSSLPESRTGDPASDEFDDMAAGPSGTLRDRVTDTSANDSTVSDKLESVKSKTKSDFKAFNSGDDSSFVLNDAGENSYVTDTSRAGWLDVDPDELRQDSDTDYYSAEERSDAEDGDFELSFDRRGGRIQRIRRDDSLPLPAHAERGMEILDPTQRNERMRNIFRNGLEIHFAGEEMEACRAIKTQLYPHQRVALAWMFQRENKATDGMFGGILADDMGLGKSLTVIALIMTNHWDGKPLCKPELGFQRESFEKQQKANKGKGKVGGAFQPKLSAKELGVGTKTNIPKKKTIGGLFAKFKACDSDSESEKENKGGFSFGREDKKTKKWKDSEFINDESSDLGSWSEGSEDEFDKMGSKKTFFKSSKTAFVKEENPIDKDNLIDVDAEEGNMSQEELMQSMIPTALDDNEASNQNLNLDGLNDLSDSDDDFLPQSKKRKMPSIESDSDDEESPAVSKGKDQGKGHGRPAKKKPNTKRRAKIEDEDCDSDASLPSPKVDRNGDSNNFFDDEADDGVSRYNDGDDDKGEPTKNKNGPILLDSRLNKETGLKLIIPPKQPAVRGRRRRATLLVCPTSLISHWTEQLERHLHESVSIKFKIHHGQTKALTGADLETHDFVITTYGTLASEFGIMDHSPLLRAKWLRVVLDEGHFIKNHRSKTAKAALSLDTIRRWVVTGTPIQNNLMEFWSLINWMNFGIYAGKSNMRYFKNDIDRPCKNGDPRGFERLQTLMDATTLRRTKNDKRHDGKPIVDLPKKTVIYRDVELKGEELAIYKLALTEAQAIVERYQRRGTLLKNYAHVFAIMMLLRQLCCHWELVNIEPDLIRKDKAALLRQLDALIGADQDNPSASGALDDNAKNLMKQLRDMIRSGVSEDCSICLDELKTPVITPCGHVYCRTCIERVLDTCKPSACPLCRRGVQKNQLLGKL